MSDAAAATAAAMAAGRDEAESLFRKATRWHDGDVAVAMKRGAINEAVGEDGEVDEDKVYQAASDLVEARPYLKAKADSPTGPLHGPSGMTVGSGRRFYGRPLADEALLRKKYPALNA